GIKLLAAILIFIIGKWIAKTIGKVMHKAMIKSKTDETLAAFISNIVYFLLLIFVVIAAIGKLGVQTASFIAIIGAAGLAIGLALQGSLANFAAGVMLILFKPFKVGDNVTSAGQTGIVHEVQMFSTILIGEDGKAIIIPNAKITGDIIVNLNGVPKP
ncbi:MAG: mechanosensitive ion channel, partial [Candidatus Cloacimonetes bacterium]|nr:mechanosensitive ion channel [Candidatus Cloacimonadota bacterium]